MLRSPIGPRLSATVAASLLLSACGDSSRDGGSADAAIYPGAAGEVFHSLYSRDVGFRIVEGGTERRVRRRLAGDLPAPPYPEWEQPTFDDAELSRIARLLERTLEEGSLSSAPLLQRAFFARDLWMAFDEMTGEGEAFERVQRLLARNLVEVAPSRAELERLPAAPVGTPLPPDLFDAASGWAELRAEHHELDGHGRLPAHTVAARGHAYFRMFLRFDGGGAREHVRRLAHGAPIDLPQGVTAVLLEYGNFIAASLEVVPSSVVLTMQSRRIQDPSSEVGEPVEYRYRRRKILAGWSDGGLDKTDLLAEGHCTLAMSNPVIVGDTLDRPLSSSCGHCHNPTSWTTEPEMRARRFGSIRSLVPNGGGGLGDRETQIRAAFRVLEDAGSLHRLRVYATR